MTRRSGLGRGLSSLIPADFTADSGVYQEIDIKEVVPNRYQPREHFDEETLVSLSRSITEIGVIQPIVVRELEDGQYELIAGGATLAGRKARQPFGHSGNHSHLR